MALNLTPKAPAGVVRYSWSAPVLAGDVIDTASITVTTGTVTIDRYGIDGSEVNFFASGGTEGETAVIAVSASTAAGETLTETLYLPIRTTAQALGNTVGDVINYALRPIVGIGNVATAEEAADARENLDQMLASWAESGADLGVKLPSEVSDVLFVPDGFLSAIKSNLRVRLCELYGQPITQSDMMAARRGEILVKFRNLPQDRAGVYY